MSLGGSTFFADLNLFKCTMFPSHEGEENNNHKYTIGKKSKRVKKLV